MQKAILLKIAKLQKYRTEHDIYFNLSIYIQLIVANKTYIQSPVLYHTVLIITILTTQKISFVPYYIIRRSTLAEHSMTIPYYIRLHSCRIYLNYYSNTAG